MAQTSRPRRSRIRGLLDNLAVPRKAAETTARLFFIAVTLVAHLPAPHGRRPGSPGRPPLPASAGDKVVRQYINSSWRPPADLPARDVADLRKLMLAARYTADRQVSKVAPALGRLAIWHQSSGRRPHRMELDDLLGLDVIADFVDELAASGVPQGTLNVWIPALNELSERLLGYQEGPRARTHKSEGVQPLSEDEVIAWLQLAVQQRDPRIRNGLLAVLLLCRGAGLTDEHARQVHAEHVRRGVDGIVDVEVDGQRMVVMDRYAEQLWQLAREVGNGFLIGPNPDAKNAVNSLWWEAEGGNKLPTPTSDKLRNGYVVEQLSNCVPVAALQVQLGVKSLALLEKMLRYALLPAEGAVRRMLAGRVRL